MQLPGGIYETSDACIYLLNVLHLNLTPAHALDSCFPTLTKSLAVIGVWPRCNSRKSQLQSRCLGTNLSAAQ
jgi:hypothetical protein